MTLHELYQTWCKETKRNGGVLIGSSIKEFFDWVEDKYALIEKPPKKKPMTLEEACAAMPDFNDLLDEL